MSHGSGNKEGEEEDVKIGLAVIWAIGVGSALGGDFFGWQFTLYGGFGSAVLAVGFCGVFYWLYAGVITELAARYKTTGGSFDFVNHALGENHASVMAVLGLLKLILANSALALAISSYLVSGGLPNHFQPVCWVCTYGFFTYLDSIGVRQSANVQVMATVLCVAILIIYSLSSFTQFSVRNLTKGGLFIDSSSGFFQGLPFALQFFDGFEEVPLLMGYAYDPQVTIPRAILLCYITIALIAGFVMVAGSGASPSAELLASEAPLMDGIDLVYGPGNVISDIMAYAIVIGMFVNFFAFVLFISQQVHAIAEAGQLPRFLAYRHPIHGAPITASVCASAYGLFLTFAFAIVFGIVPAQDTLVTAALMPAVLQYALLLQCIIKVRQVEKRQLTQALSARDLGRLGTDPSILRFSYGALGARIAQLMCFLFVASLLYLATLSVDFFFGIIVLALFGIGMYVAMRWSVGSSVTLSEHMSILDDDSQLEKLTGDMEDSRGSYYNSTLVDGSELHSLHSHRSSHHSSRSTGSSPRGVTGGGSAPGSGQSKTGSGSGAGAGKDRSGKAGKASPKTPDSLQASPDKDSHYRSHSNSNASVNSQSQSQLQSSSQSPSQLHSSQFGPIDEDFYDDL